jgi:hypothetical protein
MPRPSFSESEPTSSLSPLRLLLSEANKGRDDRRTVEGDIVGRHVYNGATLARNEASMESGDILCGWQARTVSHEPVVWPMQLQRRVA